MDTTYEKSQSSKRFWKKLKQGGIFLDLLHGLLSFIL